MAFHLVSMVLTVAVLRAGIRSGIERAAQALIPVLFVMLVGLALWAATLCGARDGYTYYFKPDFSALLDPRSLPAWRGRRSSRYLSEWEASSRLPLTSGSTMRISRGKRARSPWRIRRSP